MKTFRTQAHQGDVYLRRIDALPAGAKPIEGRATVALGETSGHHHSFPHRAQVTRFRDDGAGGGFYLKVEAPTPIEHLTSADTPTREHDSILVPPGIYALPPQMQWTDADEPIQVED